VIGLGFAAVVIVALAVAGWWRAVRADRDARRLAVERAEARRWSGDTEMAALTERYLVDLRDASWSRRDQMGAKDRDLTGRR
jgi:hypothetical protein